MRCKNCDHNKESHWQRSGCHQKRGGEMCDCEKFISSDNKSYTNQKGVKE